VLAAEHVDEAGAADPAAEDDLAGVVVDDLADDGCLAAAGWSRMTWKQGLGLLGRRDGEALALVGHVQRIQARDLAGAADFLADWDGSLVESDADLGPGGDFVEGACDTPAIRWFWKWIESRVGPASSDTRRPVSRSVHTTRRSLGVLQAFSSLSSSSAFNGSLLY
jgi:hypothetical protein